MLEKVISEPFNEKGRMFIFIGQKMLTRKHVLPLTCQNVYNYNV